MMKAPKDPAGQLQWLMDRVAISDLILSFARAIDENDGDAYADCFAEEGAIELPHIKLQGQSAIRSMTHQRGNRAALHVSANHQVDFHGNEAFVRACVIAAHVFNRESPTDNAIAGGWYDMKVVRENGEWKFASVKLNVVWTTGEMVK